MRLRTVNNPAFDSSNNYVLWKVYSALIIIKVDMIIQHLKVTLRLEYHGNKSNP